MGRPSSEIDLDYLKRLASEGKTQSQAAFLFGISVRTLRLRLAVDKQLRAAWDSGCARYKKSKTRPRGVPGRRPGRPPKVTAELTGKNESELAVQLFSVLWEKAMGGNVAALRTLADRLVPIKR